MGGVHVLNSRQVETIAITSLLVFLTTLAVVLRFVSRRMSVGKFFADDYVMIAALVRKAARKLHVLLITGVSRS